MSKRKPKTVILNSPTPAQRRRDVTTQEWDEREGMYLLPGGCAMALSTERPMFFNLDIKRIRSGEEEINKDLVITLMRLSRDLLQQRWDLKQKLEETERRRLNLQNRNDKAHDVLRGLHDGED